MLFNRLTKNLLLIGLATSVLFLTAACGSKNASGVKSKPGATASENTADNSEKGQQTPPVAVAQPLVSSTAEYEKLSEEEQEKYEAPPKQIKIKDKIIKRGHTEFSDIIFKGQGTNVTVSGRLKLVDVEDVSNEDSFEFELKGSVEDNNRKILIKMRDIDRRGNSRVRLGARVLCLESDNDFIDCSQAVVDFFVQVKETKLTHQFKTERVDKPKIPKPQPPPPPAPVEEPPKEDPTQPPPQTPPPQEPPPKVDNDEGPVEGKEDSLNGTFNTHIDAEDDIEEIIKDETKKPEPDQPEPPKKEKPKITKDGFMIKEGTMRPIDQAVRFPDEGELRRATDLVLQQRQLEETDLYYIAHPARKKHFGTFEMGLMISKLGQFTSKKHRKRFAVGNLSLQKGGESPPHASHQNGTDGDFGYPTDDDDVWFPSVVKGGRLYPESYSQEKTLALLEAAFKMTDVQIDRIFMDQLIIDDLCKTAKKNQLFDPGSSDPKWTEKNEFWKNVFRSIQHIDGHGDHMHIRIKCSPHQQLCRPKIYKKVTHCQS